MILSYAARRDHPLQNMRTQYSKLFVVEQFLKTGIHQNIYLAVSNSRKNSVHSAHSMLNRQYQQAQEILTAVIKIACDHCQTVENLRVEQDDKSDDMDKT